MNSKDTVNINEMSQDEIDKLVKDKVLQKVYDPVDDTMIYFVSNDKTSSASKMTKYNLADAVNISRQMSKRSDMRERLREKLEAKKR